MNIISRTISAALLLLVGFSLCYSAFSLRSKGGSFWVLVIYGLILIIVGILILFNKKEDEIEEIKIENLKIKKSKMKR